MKILVTSDIVWSLKTSRLLKEKILSIKPGLVLIAGDLCDKCEAKQWKRLNAFVKFLDKEKVKIFFVRGNWDECEEYDKLIEITKTLSYAEEISTRVVKFNGIRILGIPFSLTNDLKSVRKIGSLFPTDVDIVLAHSESRRRVWLFNLKTKFIITGHFDNQLCQIDNKVFISLSSFPNDYVVIDYKDTEQKISYFGARVEGKWKARTQNRNLAWVTQPLDTIHRRLHQRKLKWQRILDNFQEFYAINMEALIAGKRQVERDPSYRQSVVNDLLEKGVPRTYIEEYIGAIRKKTSQL